MAYINAQEVKAVRNELKAKFPHIKFSVTKHHHSSVQVAIMKGPKSLESLLGDDEYSRKNRASSLNHHYPDNYGEHAELIKEISEIAHNAPGRAGGTKYFNDSDIMTDYFSTSFYVNLEIGKWNKPFIAV